MISRTVMSMFLSSDFEGTVYVQCGYCHRDVMKKRPDSLDLHVVFAHMPPSDVSKELRRNLEMGHHGR